MILTKSQRARVVSWAKGRAHTDEEAAIAADAAKLAEEIRIDYNGGVEASKVIDAAPEHFFRWECGAPGEGYYYTNDIRQPHARPIAASPAEGFGHNFYTARCKAIQERKEALKAKRDEMGRELTQVLLELKTVEKARAAYPELAGVLPDPSGENLPAVVLDLEAMRAKLLVAGVIETKVAD